MDKNLKVLVLFSGGLDSTTLLYYAIKEFGRENVKALSMYYGQRHIKEQQCAEDICNMLMIPRYVKDLTSVFEFSESSMLAQGKEIVGGSYAEQFKNEGALDNRGNIASYVPFRNGLFLSVASAIAYSLGCDFVMYGAHADDACGGAYPDCTLDFVSSMAEAITQGTGGAVKISAPFINKTKDEIVLEGLQMDVPYEHTWSCYEGGKYPCHTCATCIDREEAFLRHGLQDPLVVQEHDDKYNEALDRRIAFDRARNIAEVPLSPKEYK